MYFTKGMKSPTVIVLKSSQHRDISLLHSKLWLRPKRILSNCLSTEVIKEIYLEIQGIKGAESLG